MGRHGEVCLFFDVGKSLWGDAFSNEVAELIPEEVRDDLLPGQMMIACGFHDLFDPSEREEGVFVGRAFLHVGFFGVRLANALARNPPSHEVVTRGGDHPRDASGDLRGSV